MSTAALAPSLAVAYGRQFARFYDRLFPGGAAAEPVVARLAALRADEGRPALELGVGTGRIALPLAERCGPVVGVDGSPDMLARLAQNPASSRPGRHPRLRRRARLRPRVLRLRHALDGARARRPGRRARGLRAACAPGAAVVVETHDPAAVAAMHEGRTRESFFPPTRSRAPACCRTRRSTRRRGCGARARVVRGRRDVAGRDELAADVAGRGRRVRARRRARAGGALGTWAATPHRAATDVRLRLRR